MGIMGIDPREIAQGEQQLRDVSTNASAEQIFEVLRSIVPITQCALFSSVWPAALHAMTNHAIKLPSGMLEEWMATSPEIFAMSLRKLFSAFDGESWGAFELEDKVRNGIPALQDYSPFGVGDAVGYKVMRRREPGMDDEYLLVALLTERGHSFDRRSRALLAALNPALQRAVERARVPLIATEPIFRQVIREAKHGYVCVSRSGAVLEANRRAYEIVDAYHPVLSSTLSPKRDRLIAFANRVEHIIHNGKADLHSDEGWLRISRHVLSKHAHELDQDVLLLMLDETSERKYAEELFAPLSPKERLIAHQLVTTNYSQKQIAAAADISERTVHKHVEHIYRALNVASRSELIELVRRRRSS